MTPIRYLQVLVFVVGSASLGAEIAAARLMAPFFGASTIVWANTIGVVLVALSVGYWFGGRLGDRHPHLRGLCLLVMGAAVLLAVVPFVARPFFDVSVDALDSVSAGAFVGSLIGVLFLVAVPVILLGACSPYALRLAVPDVEHSGRVAGRLYAISTAGSLLGTMLAALVLIPFAGTQRTFLAFAAALALIAALGLGWRFLALPAALVGALALPVGTVKATEDGRVLYEEESAFQYIRVVEEPDGDRAAGAERGAGRALALPARAATSPATSGTASWCCRSPPSIGPRDGWRSSATAPARRPAPTATSSPAPAWTGWRSIRSWRRSAGATSTWASNPNLTVHNEDARPWLRRSRAATT